MRPCCGVPHQPLCCDAQALITFLYVDFLDATGTLFSMVRACCIAHIEVLLSNGDVPRFLS